MSTVSTGAMSSCMYSKYRRYRVSGGCVKVRVQRLVVQECG